MDTHDLRFRRFISRLLGYDTVQSYRFIQKFRTELLLLSSHFAHPPDYMLLHSRNIRLQNFFHLLIISFLRLFTRPVTFLFHLFSQFLDSFISLFSHFSFAPHFSVFLDLYSPAHACKTFHQTVRQNDARANGVLDESFFFLLLQPTLSKWQQCEHF